jgi:phosphonate transport system substrate-binding protein
VKLTFGLVPHRDDDNIRTVLNDFCALLSRLAGVTLLPHRAPSPSALAAAVHSGRVQLAWMSPTLLVTDPRLSNVVPLVSSVREGASFYHSVLFVAEGGPVRRLADLQGRHAAWVAPTSASGYLFPRLSLARRGLDLGTLFASETFCQSFSVVSEAVLVTGEADVGASFAVFEGADPQRQLLRAGFLDAELGRPARIIDIAGPIAADVIVVSSSLPLGLRLRLSTTLQHMVDEPQGRELLGTLFGVDGFNTVSPESLRTLRDFVKMARELGLLAAT